MAFKQLSKIDKRAKYTVYGWIRRQEKSLISTHFPSMITAICILYFSEEEVFAIINKGIKLSENKKRITMVDFIQQSIDNNYGLIEIPSISDGLYKWDLKIIRETYGNGINIGIASKETRDRHFISNNAMYYLVCANHSKSCNSTSWRTDNEWFQTGDKVSIILDLKQAQMRMSVNDRHEMTLFTNIQKSDDIKYLRISKI